MRLLTILLTMLFASALAACTPAATPAASPPLSYDCDTPAGRLSELEQVQPGPAYRISGTIRADDLLPNDRWESAGNVFVESADEHENWGTIGVSENIIEASWRALADSIEYGLMVAH